MDAYLKVCSGTALLVQISSVIFDDLECTGYRCPRNEASDAEEYIIRLDYSFL